MSRHQELDIIDVIVVGLLVNLAASALFYSLQGYLDHLKRTRPMLAHSLSIIFLIIAVVAFLGIRMLSKVSVDFEETKIYLPRSHPQIYSALPLPLIIMLLSYVLEGLLNPRPELLRFQNDNEIIKLNDRLLKQNYWRSQLIRPVESAFLVGIGIVGYKIFAFSKALLHKSK